MRTEGRDRLRDHLRRNGISQSAFARMVGKGRTQQTVSAWLSGDTRPDVDERTLIRHATNGYVIEEMWRTAAERAEIEEAIARQRASAPPPRPAAA